MAGSDWPQFRGPRGDGHSDAKNVPLRWSAKENVAWVREIPGRGWSSPVVVDGKVYLTTAVVTDGGAESNPKADRSLRAMCLDAASGKTLWDAEVFKQDGARAPATIHQKNGHASPTPIVADGRVYVHFGHQGSAALDLNGKKIWENRTFGYPPRHGAGASPILVDGKLIVSCDGEENPFVLALDARTGAVAWRVARPPNTQLQKFAFGTCTAIEVDGVPQVISPGAGAMDSFALGTGKHLWRLRYEGYSVVPKAVFAHDLVYTSSSYDTPDVYCIDPRNATGDITDTHVKWVEGSRAPMTVSLLVIGDEIYWVY